MLGKTVPKTAAGQQPQVLDSFHFLVYHHVLLPQKGTLFLVGGTALEPHAH